MEYQLKQESGRSGSGDMEFIGGIKRMAFTMWEGLRVKDDKTGNEVTLLELLQGGTGSDVNLDKKINPFNFSAGSMQNMLAAQQYSNALNLFNWFFDEHDLGFDRGLARDSRGRLIVDPKLDVLFRGKILKGLRYAFDMGEYYYNRDIRSWEKDSKTGKTIIKTQELQDFMFSEEVINMGMYEKRKDSKGNDIEVEAINKAYRKDGEREVLKQMSRNLAGWVVGREMWKHRRQGSKYRLYTAAEYDNIEEYLRNIPLEVGLNDQNVAEVKHAFFTSKEVEKIRKAGKVERGKLNKENAYYSLFDATSGMFSEMFKKFITKL